jgi:hypothetical protein
LNQSELSLAVAEKSMANYVGPRGLQKLVSNRRKQGVKLPFVVNVRNGLPYFVVKWIDASESYLDETTRIDLNATVKPQWRSPGGWKSKVLLGDTLVVSGVKFLVVRPPIRKKAKEPLNQIKSGKNEDDNDNVDAKSEITTAKKSVTTEAESDEEDEEEDDDDESDDDESQVSISSFEEDVFEDRIYVDRPWLLEDKIGV